MRLNRRLLRIVFAVLPAALVERTCCRLGIHPSEIYGRDWEAVLDRSRRRCDLDWEDQEES